MKIGADGGRKGVLRRFREILREKLRLPSQGLPAEAEWLAANSD